MAYSATYDTADFQAIVVDGMGTFGASIVSFVSLIVILLILGFILKQGKQLGRIIPN